MSSGDQESEIAELDKFADSIQKLEESIASWGLSTPGRKDEIENLPQHHALEAEGGVIKRVITIGETIDELGTSIACLDPNIIKPVDFEFPLQVLHDDNSSPTSIELTQGKRPTPSSRCVATDDDADEDEDIYNSSEILNEDGQLTEQLSAPQCGSSPIQQGAVDETDRVVTSAGPTQLTKLKLDISSSSNSAQLVRTEVHTFPCVPAVPGYEEEEEEEDLYNSSEEFLTLPTDGTEEDLSGDYVSMHPLERAEEPGTCTSTPSNGREDSEGDYVTMMAEFSDPNRCLSVPILQPKKDLSRCICGVENGFDELRNEEGLLVAIECCYCTGTWLSINVTAGSSHFRMTWEGADYYLNVPIRINTMKMNTAPISSADELQRGDHIMLDRGIYFHHSIVVAVLPQGVKLMHWGYRKGVEIVWETKSLSEFSGVSKVLYEKEDPVELVIARAARARVKGVDNYHIIENNCESFATYCKTGHFVSVESEALRKFYPGIIRVLDYFNFNNKSA